MEQSQLIELIKTLKPKEKEQILQFAALSFFPRSKMKTYVEPLLRICVKHPWHDPEQTLEKEVVCALLFPGQKIVEGKLEKVMVEAQKVVRAFLLAQYYFREENEFHQVFDFAEIVRLRGLEARYRVFLLRLRKIQEESPTQNTFYFHDQFLLEYAVHNEESLYNQVKGDLNIPKALDALETHTHLNRIALLNVYLLQQKAANIDAPEAMKERLEEANVPSRFLGKYPILDINYTIFNLLKKETHEVVDVRMLFDQLLLHEKNLDVDTLKGFYTYLRNICILIIFKDSERDDINNLLFELYNDNLERGYLHYEGKLHPSKYLAISECAATAGEHAWALAFIEKHKHEIIGDNETRDVYRLNLAYYLFNVGRFSDCLDNIPETSPYVDYLLAVKRLEIKALYELHSDLLPYKLDAFKMFLSRTSQKLLPQARRQKNVDFMNLLFQLVASIPGDPKRASRLIERVEEKKQAAEWRWLMAKAKQLQRKGS